MKDVNLTVKLQYRLKSQIKDVNLAGKLQYQRNGKTKDLNMTEIATHPEQSYSSIRTRYTLTIYIKSPLNLSWSHSQST